MATEVFYAEFDDHGNGDVLVCPVCRTESKPDEIRPNVYWCRACWREIPLDPDVIRTREEARKDGC